MSPRADLAREVILHAGLCPGRLRWRAARCSTACALLGACRVCGWTRVLIEDPTPDLPPVREAGPPDWLPAAVLAAFDEEATR